MQIRRYSRNPILEPSGENWEVQGVFNPTIIKEGNNYHLLYRALSAPQLIKNKQVPLSVIGQTKSSDGINFGQRKIFLAPQESWEEFGCEDPRVTKLEDEYFIFYTALSDFPPKAENIKLAVALSPDLEKVTERHLVTPFNAKAMALFPQKIKDQYVAILTVNTDLPPSLIAIAYFKEKQEIWSPQYWHHWYQNLSHHLLAVSRLNSDQVEVGPPPLKTQAGWLLIYSHIQRYRSPDYRLFGVEALLLDLNNPQKIIARTTKPFLIPEEWYELKGLVPRVTFPSGLLQKNEELWLYYGAADTRCCLAFFSLNDLFQDPNFKKKPVPKLQKYKNNPILEPIADHPWEAKAVFNPAAVWEEDKFYLIYRALSMDNTSVLGCALSEDGFTIKRRLPQPIYEPRQEWEKKKKPMANSGCEDPRLTKLGDRYYLCYTAFTGANNPRLALSSISIKDFINQNWQWSEPILLSSPEIDDKNGCLLPEKINNQYVIFHRPGGKDIYVDFLDSLNLPPNQYLANRHKLGFSHQEWCELKTGIVAPPLKTNKGWLALFHGVSAFDNEYRVGYMLLSLTDPTKVTFVSEFPLLEATHDYERHGLVDNVVFPCGVVLIKEKVFVYYGGADRVVCVASIDLKQLLI